MKNLNKIVRFLNKELNVRNINDSSRNGLQVRSAEKINKIGFAVDACLSTFKRDRPDLPESGRFIKRKGGNQQERRETPCEI